MFVFIVVTPTGRVFFVPSLFFFISCMGIQMLCCVGIQPGNNNNSVSFVLDDVQLATSYSSTFMYCCTTFLLVTYTFTLYGS